MPVGGGQHHVDEGEAASCGKACLEDGLALCEQPTAAFQRSGHAFGFPVDHCAFGCRVIQALRDDAHFVARAEGGLRCTAFFPRFGSMDFEPQALRALPECDQL